jgi:ATP-dependent DNA ligase
MSLPLSTTYRPMEAMPESELPVGPQWHYEPKWDGFRCLAFRDGESVNLESKSQKPLTRYFPELAAALLQLRARRFVLDGEIVIPADGGLSFDHLLMRIHPAESRIRKLSKETPCVYIVFDLLVDERGRSLVGRPLEERREHLERFAKAYFSKNADHVIRLSPVTHKVNVARKWFHMGVGLDGIVAKRDDLPYQSGERTGMQKIKKRRTADCVVGGFRYLEKEPLVGSRGIYFFHSSGESRGPDEGSRSDGQAAGLYGQSAGRFEPLEHQALHGMETARAEAGGRSGIRSLYRGTIPAWDKISALAAGESSS